jgi:tRNA modification GTPase
VQHDSARTPRAPRAFHEADGARIDDGIALWFAAPHSYTGEDVVELQAHGSPPLLARLLARCLALGARAARPGEFTERAFLEGKLDLAQAEAVADLIGAGSDAAARAARRSLEASFSRRVHALVEELTVLRVHVEAGFDFPDEDIDALASAGACRPRLRSVRDALHALRAEAARGLRLADGLHAVIVGAPNVGKSSLLNALAADERAIVSAVAGTTRDLLREQVRIDGIELTLVDTAGLRESADAIEAEGMRRARAELDRRRPGAAGAGRARTRGADAGLAHARARRHRAAAIQQVRRAGRRHAAARARRSRAPRRARRRRAVGSPRAPAWAWTRCAPGCANWPARPARTPAAASAARGPPPGRRSTRPTRCWRRRGAAGRAATRNWRRKILRRAQAALGEITAPLDADALLGRIFAGFCIGKYRPGAYARFLARGVEVPSEASMRWRWRSLCVCRGDLARCLHAVQAGRTRFALSASAAARCWRARSAAMLPARRSATAAGR